MKIRILKRTLLFLLLIFVMIIILYPFMLMVLTSLKSESELFTNNVGFPESPKFSNYIEVFKVAEIPRLFANSVIITSLSLFSQVIFASLAAYALTKMRFRRSGLFFNLFLIPIIFSIHFVVLPIFIMFKYMNLLDTYLGAILIYTAVGIPIAVIILTAFMKSIPYELSEAAHMDGASHFTIYSRVILPLLKGPIAAICVINGLYVWNDFFVPLMFFLGDDLMTLPQGIFKFSSQYARSWTLIFTDIIYTIVPFIILYIFLQRYIIKGVTQGAIKG